MPLFGIRYADWDKATSKPPLPYDEWEILDGQTFPTFDEAKAAAARHEEDHSPRHWVVMDTFDAWGNREESFERIPGHNPIYKFVAYKVPEEQNYMEREPKRIAEGRYELLPEHMRPDHRSWTFLFPRLLENKMIGLYASERDAAHDRLTEMKPTRYFARYHPMPENAWDYMAELGLVAAGLTLAFATTREDIRFIYENGPESCMSSPARNYGFGGENAIHPTEAYASPDLELAYLYRGDDHTQPDAIVARALCNAKTKQYVRIYGDFHRMQKMLEEAGYTENQYALGGCRVLKIFAKLRDGTTSENVVMTPYLDGNCNSMELKSLEDEFLVIRRPEMIVSGNTGGIAELPL